MNNNIRTVFVFDDKHLLGLGHPRDEHQAYLGQQHLVYRSSETRHRGPRLILVEILAEVVVELQADLEHLVIWHLRDVYLIAYRAK